MPAIVCKQRRLAAAALADERHLLAVLHLELRNIENRQPSAIRLGVGLLDFP